MGSPIRVSSNGHWGTCFAISRGSEIRFVSVAHVLRDCGIHPGTPAARVLMCDEQRCFWGGPQLFSISNIQWDEGCDYVEFDSDFPAQPYAMGQAKVSHGLSVNGYLHMPSGEMPDCGISSKWDAAIRDIVSCAGNRQWALLIMLDGLDWGGLSGGPVLDGEVALAAFVGKLKLEKGGHLVAVAL